MTIERIKLTPTRPDAANTQAYLQLCLFIDPDRVERLLHPSELLRVIHTLQRSALTLGQDAVILGTPQLPVTPVGEQTRADVPRGPGMTRDSQTRPDEETRRGKSRASIHQNPPGTRTSIAATSRPNHIAPPRNHQCLVRFALCSVRPSRFHDNDSSTRLDKRCNATPIPRCLRAAFRPARPRRSTRTTKPRGNRS